MSTITPTTPSTPATEPPRRKRLKLWMKIVIGVVAAAILAVTAGPFIYIHFIKDDAPKELSLSDVSVATTDAGGATATTAAPDDVATTAASDDTVPAGSTDSTASTAGAATTAPAATSTGSGADGTYTITGDSVVGYRVVEVLFGQDTEGVGRTSAVTGTIVIAGTQVTTADFTVDMTTVTSDESRRDRQFNGRLLETDEFPTATFVLTSPIELGSVPGDGEQISTTATGDLTLHGVTKSVTIELTAQKTGTTVAVSGATDISFADYEISDPSTNGISTQDHGLLEFLLVATA